MQRRFSSTLVAVALAGALAIPAAAQAVVPAFNIRAVRAQSQDVTPSDLLTAYNDGSVVARTRIGLGILPTIATNDDALLWHAYRGAFRAGGTNGLTDVWSDANIGFYSWAGGYGGRASGLASLGFGDRVLATGQGAVALGIQSYASGTAGFSMGYRTSCNESYCIAIGYRSNATGTGAVAIGYQTTADADYSLALGHRASTNGYRGAMVFGDNSTTDSVEASANNQFLVRAAGGYRLHTNATLTTGVALNAGGSSWNVISDRHRKENFENVEGEALLGRLRTLPVTSWRYIAEEDRTVRHIGPMAQDWHRAFGLSADSTTINTGDFDGVNLAAAQALLVRTDALAADATVLSASHDALAATLARTRADLDAARADLAATRRDLADARARLDALGTVAADMARLRAALDALLARTPAPAPAPAP